jgi:polysaccharide export outer membrane protein
MSIYIRKFATLLGLLVVWQFAGGAESVVAETTGPSTAITGPDYVIGPGDVLQVFVWRNPELTLTVPVRPDGRITTPLVADMVAVGKSPAVLARDIEKILGEFVRSPQVNVIVTQAVSAFSQVKVVGSVQRPQALAYREGMTVLDAILAVGGFAEFAAPNRSKLMRKETDAQGKPKEIRLKLGKLLNDPDPELNILLKPGDILSIPESRF